MTYPNEALTAVCDMLMTEYDLTLGQIADLARDIPGECEAMAEAAWGAMSDPERIAASHDAFARAMIDAGRGHLVK